MELNFAWKNWNNKNENIDAWFCDILYSNYNFGFGKIIILNEKTETGGKLCSTSIFSIFLKIFKNTSRKFKETFTNLKMFIQQVNMVK